MAAPKATCDPERQWIGSRSEDSTNRLASMKPIPAATAAVAIAPGRSADTARPPRHSSNRIQSGSSARSPSWGGQMTLISGGASACHPPGPAAVFAAIDTSAINPAVTVEASRPKRCFRSLVPSMIRIRSSGCCDSRMASNGVNPLHHAPSCGSSTLVVRPGRHSSMSSTSCPAAVSALAMDTGHRPAKRTPDPSSR